MLAKAMYPKMFCTVDVTVHKGPHAECPVSGVKMHTCPFRAASCQVCLVLVAAMAATAHTNVSKVLPPIEVDGLSAADITVHILATAKATTNGKHIKHDYLKTRLVGGASTWGRDFPSLTFVFGREDLGKAKVETGCTEASAPEGFKRATCANGAFTMIQLDNCTDEYYGEAGPCCRLVRVRVCC